MSAEALQRKLNKAYGKIAKKTGFPSDLYRAQSYDRPLQTSNWIESIDVAFSQNDKFNAPVGSNTWLAWIDASLGNKFDLEVGDIVKSNSGSVYYIIDMHPLHPIRALETNSTITIATQGGYGTTDGEWGVDGYNQKGTAIPAWVSITGSTTIDGGFVPARTALTSGNELYTIQLWMPEGSIKVNDVIILKDGTELQVTSAAWDIRGYKLTAEGIK